MDVKEYIVEIIVTAESGDKAQEAQQCMAADARSRGYMARAGQVKSRRIHRANVQKRRTIEGR